MEDPAASGAGSLPTNGNGNGGGKGKPAAPKRPGSIQPTAGVGGEGLEGFQLGPETPGREAVAEVLRPRPPPPSGAPARPEPLLSRHTCGANRSLNSRLAAPDPLRPSPAAGRGLPGPLASPLGARR